MSNNCQHFINCQILACDGLNAGTTEQTAQGHL